MISFRACVFSLVILVQFHCITSKPFLDDLLCDLICDDDDDSSSTSTESFFGLFDCDCTPDTTKRPPGNKRGQFQGALPPLVDMIFPLNGLNITMDNTNGRMIFNMNGRNGVPPGAPGAPPGGAAATTAAPTTAAGGTTAAGTTAAATTAASG